MMDLPAIIDVSTQGVSELDLEATGLRVDEEFWWSNELGGLSTSGEMVNAAKIVGHPPINQAITVLSGDTAQVPIRLMDHRDPDDAKVWSDSPLDRLVSFRPNHFQTPAIFYETMMQNALIYGNGLAHIVRDSGGRATAMIPLPPEHTYIVQPHDRLNPMIRTRYAYNYPEMILTDYDVIHIRGLCQTDWSLDGWWGVSLLDAAKNAFGYSLTLEMHGASTFRNGARPSIIIFPPGKIDKEAAATLRAAMHAVHGGARNTNRTGILRQGTEVKELSASSNIDAQWLDARKLDREHIASLFNLPAYKLNSLDNSSTRSNLEEQNRDYWNSSLSRWLNRFVEEFNAKLLNGSRPRDEVYYRAFPETFLRGDQASRFANYATAIGARFMVPNEAREKEGWNPLPGGDELQNPAIDTIQSTGTQSEQEGPEDNEPDQEQEEQLQNMVKGRVQQLLYAEVQKRASHRTALQARGFYNSYQNFARRYVEDLFTDNSWVDIVKAHAKRSRECKVKELVEVHSLLLTQAIIKAIT